MNTSLDGQSVKYYPDAMTDEPCKIDPRIRRTRQMLFRAFQELLAEKTFDQISVQDLAERSTLNRATFYDHFTDKFALLEAMVGESHHGELGDHWRRAAMEPGERNVSGGLGGHRSSDRPYRPAGKGIKDETSKRSGGRGRKPDHD